MNPTDDSRELNEAKTAFQKVISIDPRSAQGFACLGMIHHALNELDDAITRYHEALSIVPLDASVIELLNIALTMNATLDPLSSSTFTSNASSQETTNAQAFIAAGAGGPVRKPGGLSVPPPIPPSIQAAAQSTNGRPNVNRPARVGTNPSWHANMTATQEKFGGRPELMPNPNLIPRAGGSTDPRMGTGAGAGGAVAGIGAGAPIESMAPNLGPNGGPGPMMDGQGPAYRHMQIVARSGGPGMPAVPRGPVSSVPSFAGPSGGVPNGTHRSVASRVPTDDLDAEEVIQEVSMEVGDDDASMDVED